MLTGKAGLLRKIACLLAAVFAIAPVELLVALAGLLGIGYLAGGIDGIWATLLPSLLCAYGAGVLASALRVARWHGATCSACAMAVPSPMRPRRP